MKLKDILKTDTDNKGWLRVFKKLGADAEMLKYVNENISKSGGGEEGVKEYYYKILTENEAYDAEMFQTIALFTGISHCIAPIEENIYIKIHNLHGNYYNGLYDVDFLNSVKAFAITENETTIYTATREVEGSFNNSVMYIPKGNVNEKLKKAAEDNSAPYEQIISLFNASFQEITKEEYESMITYKP